ncbi:ribose/xylose/arabinose/galactoside ABC-type transport system permease subunit [Natranaerovirga pectinivora]|uniref:Ribose/xylose/arabinose/galactoside ABC-type transport system permease subunit n=2 Tax=Natranaerovirga pectinivora TaxID=682400 RepID=A0A4R3MLG3_9FIRM|nr:ribose/xylose/arabinose/galactoside ABC-type transport system permease subunit [Natranaerovirga pectinivora]
MKNKKNIYKTAYVLSVPLVVGLIMEVIVYMQTGGHLISSMLDIRNIIRDLGVTALIAFALSLNLGSGRFDLSLGAQRLVATIIGGNIALRLGFNGIGVLIMAILFGLLAGFVVGMIFITFRVPPVILGLGMAMVYESLAFAGSRGLGLQLFGAPNTRMLVNPNFTLMVLGLATLFVFVLFTYTKFRYEMQAMRGSQKIAKTSGINVFRHVVICYTIAGGLVAIAGVLSAAMAGALLPTLGMTSNSAVIAMTFPMFIGTYLSRRSNIALGIISASLTIRLFGFGMVALQISTALNTTINMILFIGFLAFLANRHIPDLRKREKARIKEAKAKIKERKELSLAS